VEAPGTAPGSERLIAVTVYRHSHRETAPINIGDAARFGKARAAADGKEPGASHPHALRAELFPWLAMQTFVSACFEHSADLAFLSSAESPALLPGTGGATAVVPICARACEPKKDPAADNAKLRASGSSGPHEVSPSNRQHQRPSSYLEAAGFAKSLALAAALFCA